VNRPQTWDELERCITRLTYDDGSRFELQRDDAANYAVLYVYLHAPNSYRGAPGRRINRYTRHEFVVPVATYNYENWRRWVYERLCSAAIHEVGEWFMDQGVRVFAPHHGAGEDPYVQWQLGTQAAANLAPGQHPVAPECSDHCAYGVCSGPELCGGCCRCLGPCVVAWERSQPAAAEAKEGADQ